MLRLLLISLVFATGIATGSAQKLASFGSPPDPALAGRVLLEIAPGCPSRVLTYTASALSDLGYTIFLDGERQRAYSGLITTVTVRDTSFSRRGSDIAIRRIHGTAPTDLTITVGGTFVPNGVRRYSLNVMDAETGELYFSIATDRLSNSLSYEEYALSIRKAFMRVKPVAKDAG